MITEKTFKVIIDGVPVSFNKEIVEIAYNPLQCRYYWRRGGRGAWTPRNQGDTKLHLKACGLDGRRVAGTLLSQVDEALRFIHDNNEVDFAIALAGWTEGCLTVEGKTILVTRGCSPTVAAPVPWPNLGNYINELLGEEPALHHMGWWNWARKNILSREILPGQIPIYVGKAGSGKSFMQKLTTRLLGGRASNPFAYMAGKSTFNSELFMAEHLVIEDQFFDCSGKTRREFGAKMKELTVNHVHWCHRKGAEALNLPPKWRLSMSMNSERENLNVLPPLDDSLLEKIMLFNCGEPTFPTDLSTSEGWKEWDDIIDKELPGLAHAIDTFVVPERMRNARYGVKPWHDPELMAFEQEHSQEEMFWSIIQHDLPSIMEKKETVWEGTAVDLERILTGGAMPSRDQSRKLLSWPGACGTFLGRIHKNHKTQIDRRMRRGQTVWKIDLASV